MRILTSLAIAALMSTATVNVSQAQAPQCGERAKIVAFLSGKHKEQQTLALIHRVDHLAEHAFVHSNRRTGV